VTATTALTGELRAEVLRLTDDLRIRLAADSELSARWRDEHRRAGEAKRTAGSWSDFSEERLTQAAVAWVLATVFVRFCEDNDLIEPVWITGRGTRRQEALDAQDAFMRETVRTNPDVTDREWLLQAGEYLAVHKATAALVDRSSPVWLIAPSGDAATRLLAFWRERDEEGLLVRDLADPSWDTRFLGDLYQDLSEAARSRYALLQTPVFVEEFILDRTLTPALRDRPLEGFKLIDPTCGSGHFLLGAFARILDRWHSYAPALDERERVQRALESIYGVDINPFAVAISRFRLMVAALKASGDRRLDAAPAYRFHLAVGDSLLHGLDQGELDYGNDFALIASHDTAAAGFAYATENLDELHAILKNGQFDCVVGNPPYITVKDKALNAEYRRHYSACKGTYAMTVPFAQRFFGLARDGERPGWVGQITSNSFMKREFGSKLIEDFFPRVDLCLVADTSGAYIPGHGTPTVILVGRSCRPTTDTVRAVLGVRGEPGRPDDASTGIVWTDIVEHVDELGWNDEWITVADLSRGQLAKHPWSLTGGGTALLLQHIDTASTGALSRRISLPVGRSIRAGADEAYMRSQTGPKRLTRSDWMRPLVLGEAVRDWNWSGTDMIIYPYIFGSNDVRDDGIKWTLWRWRSVLSERMTFQGSMTTAGRPWWAYMQHTVSAYQTSLSITFAFVATHNHFVLDRGRKVFKQSAPVIKLPEGATEDDHLALLGVLNSSTACFWLKQNSHNKGSTVDQSGARQTQVPWENFYEFTGTTLQDFPLPTGLSPVRGRTLDDLARLHAQVEPSAVAERVLPDRDSLMAARSELSRLGNALIAAQEELDWDVYRLYGLIDEDLTYAGDDLPDLTLGERAFEILLARRVAAGDETTAWFTRHGSTPITEIPSHWPAAYQELVAKRIALAESHPYLKLLERPENKRRWASESWEKKEERALRGWLLDRLEDRKYWFDAQNRPVARSIATLSDEVSRDIELTGVLALWEGRPDIRVTESLTKLLSGEAVPYLAAYRYTEAGLRKHADWLHVWELQRAEDSSGQTNPSIPVPPKYKPVEFRSKDYWTHRGKLDVPKERFILCPGAGRATDPTPVLGWAGWDHAEQALALAQLVQNSADSDQREPLVAGLAELQPWLDQWHSKPDPFYGGQSPASYFRTFLTDQARQLERTLDQLAAWRPPAPTRGRRAAGGKADRSSTLVESTEGG
jgi:hypothetical protein